MVTFQYTQALVDQFPGVVGGVIFAEGMSGGPSSDALKAAFTKEQQATIARIGDDSLSEIDSLAAWRAAFRRFGAQPTKHRSAAEALLRRLTKKGDIPSINRLVDMGNLVSIRYGLPVAVFDLREVTGAVSVHLADGTERFVELGDETVKHPEVGEVVFSDETEMVLARRWCWRQSAESAAREDTTMAIITVEAQHDDGRGDVEAAVSDLLALFKAHAGGTYTSAIVDASSPVASG